MKNRLNAPGPKRPTLADLNAEVSIDHSAAPCGPNVWARFPDGTAKCIGRLAPPITRDRLDYAEPYYARNA